MRFAARLPALAAAFAILAASPPPDPLAALAAANGHPAAVHLRATGTRLVEGRTVVVTLDLFGTSRLVRRCVAGVCGGTWFDGTRAWTFGLNEVVLPEPDDATVLIERTLMAIASYAFAEPAFRNAGGTAVRSADGRWRVRAPGGVELLATIDPAAQTVRRVETLDGTMIAGYGRDTRAGGAQYALARSGPYENGPLDEVAVVAEPLRPPSGPVASVSGDAALALASDPIPIVPCSLGGRTLRCLLDSGATPSAITLSLAEELKLEPHGELEIAGLGRFATGFVDAGPLALGPARFERVRFAVVPPSSATHFDVVIGSDLLGRIRVVLDRGRKTVHVMPSGSSTTAADAVRLGFRNGSPIVAAMLGPQGTHGLLDTGDAAILSLGYAEYRLGPQWRVLERGQALGMGGAEDAFVVEIPEVRVGPLALGATRATVRRTQTVAHVGIGLWDRFVVDLDEAAGRVEFRPR